MAAGEVPRGLNRAEHAMVAAAVDRAEQHTGLQFCVYLGDLDDTDPRADAEAKFVETGLLSRPAVLVLVSPVQHRIEIVTSERARRRIPDADAEAAVEAMTTAFRRGELCRGILEGVETLERAAGWAETLPEDEELPDVLRG